MIRPPHANHAAAHTLALLLCLLTLDTSATAQSATPPAQATPAQDAAPAAQPVRMSVIVTDASGRSAAGVRQEEIAVAEDGQAQAVTRFAAEEPPVSYGLVIDNSRSLARRLDSVIKAAEAILRSNRPGDETFVLRFVDGTKIELLQDYTSDLGSLNDAVASLYAEGGSTAVIDAVTLAVNHADEKRGAAAGRRRALVLISDCEDRSSSYKQSDLVDLLRRKDVQVFVIALPGEMQSPPARARKLAETIASESGGRYFLAQDGPALQAAVEEVARNLRAQYALEYRSTNAARDGKFRKVEVKAAGGRRVFARPGYFAGK